MERAWKNILPSDLRPNSIFELSQYFFLSSAQHLKFELTDIDGGGRESQYLT
jgi:hypothetical protein